MSSIENMIGSTDEGQRIDCPECGTPHHNSHYECNICGTTMQERKPTWFSVAVFVVSREYGGPEEGGWYYDAGMPCKDAEYVQHMRIFKDEGEAIKYRRFMQLGLDIFLNPLVRGIGGRVYFQAHVTDEDYPRFFPEKRPHYE